MRKTCFYVTHNVFFAQQKEIRAFLDAKMPQFKALQDIPRYLRDWRTLAFSAYPHDV